MKNQDPFPWMRFIYMVAMLAFFAFRRRDTGFGASSHTGENGARPAQKPRFIWGDWELKEEDCIVLQFRVEGSLIWWLTVETEDPHLKDTTVMPKNFLPGECGRIEMRYPGLLEGIEEESLEFGIRYCTPTGTIETQFFKWSLWQDAAPVAVEVVSAA